MSDDLVARLERKAQYTDRYFDNASLGKLYRESAAEIRSLREQVAKERAGIVAWLRVHGKWPRGTSHAGILADAIERHEDKGTTA